MSQRSFTSTFRKNRLGLVGFGGVVFFLLLGIFAPLITSYPKGYGTDIMASPSFVHLFGTDGLGLDILSEIIWGARTSIYVSFIAVALAFAIGVPAGLVSGYIRGFPGAIIDTLIDVFLTLPVLPLIIVIAAVVGSSITNVAIVIGLFSWPSLARVTRNATLRVTEMQFIEAARCLGIKQRVILFKHILIVIIGPILVNLTLIMATSVLSEAGLSFLGLGDPSTWSWGTIIKKAWDAGAIIDTPNPYWWWFAPSLSIVFYVVCFNLLGNAINDALNPKGRE
jgi:peptide/nickel transport system permease protein|uniref:ABC transporter permease n=1 Tax=candidate division WOR-3 bacterium TaxID=2052148 RepID=A0A7V3KMP3_UNCW3